MKNILFSNKMPLVLGLALFVFNILLYLSAMKGDFVYDDVHLIRNSPITQNPDFIKNFIGQAFGDPLGRDANSRELEKGMQYYRPLIALSFWLDYKIWGLNAAGFHLTNILLHALNVILLFWLLLRCFNSMLAAAGSACLFSVFPTHFENVAWISGRTDLLAFLLLLISAHFLLSFVKSSSYRHAWLSALFFFSALLSKETVLLSLLAYLYAVFFYGKKGSSRPRFFFILVFAAAILFFFFLRSQAVSVPQLKFSIFSLQAFFSGVGFYFSRLLFPFNLGLSIADEKVLFSPLYFIAGISLILLVAAAAIHFLVKRKLPPVYFVGGALSLLFLLPSLVILFFEYPAALLAWRFLYLPLAAILPLLAVFLSRKLRPRLYGLLMVLLTLVLAMELLPHVRHYGQGNREFWLNLRHPERESRTFRLNHAANLLAVNEKGAAVLLEPFIADRTSFLADFFRRRALEIGAFHFTAANNLEKARSYWVLLLSQYQGQPLSVHFQYAAFLAKAGNPDKGKELVDQQLRVFPENHEVLLHAADFYLLIQDPPRAMALLKKDYRLFPTTATLARINSLMARPQPD